MSQFPSKEEVERIKEEYPIGTRIELDRELENEKYSKLKAGDRGYVEHIDSAGQIHMRWDIGSGLALVKGVDSFHKLTVAEIEAEQAQAGQTQDETEDEDELEL